MKEIGNFPITTVVMSNYARKQIEKLRVKKAEEDEIRKIDELRSKPQTTPYKAIAYVKDVYRRVVDNGYVKQGIKSHEAGKFEQENPLAKGGHGTYAIHEYGGTQLSVELNVPGKQPFFVNVRPRVLEINHLKRLVDSQIEILKRNNVGRRLEVIVVDTTSRYHGDLVDIDSVINQLH
ncbi:MAG: hypothetical protein WCP12_13965 [bacterium]